MNHLPRIFGEKLDVKFKDKYTGQTFTVRELNEAFLKPMIQMGTVEKEMNWFERFEKI